MSGKAQSWRKSVLTLQLYEINCEISLDKYDIKRSRKSYSNNICHSSPYVKMISHYASVNFFLTHTVYAYWTCSFWGAHLFDKFELLTEIRNH